VPAHETNLGRSQKRKLFDMGHFSERNLPSEIDERELLRKNAGRAKIGIETERVVLFGTATDYREC
jgi:hypothetical protein